MNPQRDNIIAAGVGGLPPSTPAIRWASAEAQRRGGRTAPGWLTLCWWASPSVMIPPGTESITG